MELQYDSCKNARISSTIKQTGEESASVFVFFSETLMGEVMSQNSDAQEFR